MNLKIWSKEISMEYEPNQLYVKLEVDQKGGHICLRVVDGEGEEIKWGTILSLDKELKCLVIFSNLNEIVPLKTDIDGCILSITEIEYIEKARNEREHSRFVSNLVSILTEEEEESCKH